MNKICLSIAALLLTVGLYGQHTLQVKVLDAVSKKPLGFASVSPKGVPWPVVADSTGLAELKISAGKNTITVSHIGYEEQSVQVVIPVDSILVVELTLSEEEEEEVVIQSTRSSRTINDIPTRVEFVAGEELDEKANMKPGDIRMVLNESTGITTQQTSATSANASIRIQGLDGRYTQILKDGFPLYAGFSSGLGLLQTPPLDLKQFEVIKGSASTLYGGGAIAGLVDLISKTPGEERELKLHFDVTSAGGLNTSGFYGKKFGKAGLTLFASRNSNSAFDPDDTILTAIPRFERYTANPKLFLYINSKTNLNLGVNFTTEERLGGDIAYIKGNNPSGFYEKNNTDRISSQISFDHEFGDHEHIAVKNSVGHFRRVILGNAYTFGGTQTSSFTEITYSAHGEQKEWIAGLNLVTDNFEEVQYTLTPLRSYLQ